MSREPDGQRLLRNSRSICVGCTLSDVGEHNNGNVEHASRPESQGQPQLLPEHSRTLGLPSAGLCCGNDIVFVRFPMGTL